MMAEAALSKFKGQIQSSQVFFNDVLIRKFWIKHDKNFLRTVTSMDQLNAWWAYLITVTEYRENE